MLVVITGLPGSGKSTLARELHRALDLPLIGKDRFKEILFDALGGKDEAWSRQIGRAAIAIQFEVMRAVGSAVVDSALWTGVSEPELEALGHPMVQVWCDCPFEVARARFLDRAARGERHAGFAEDGVTEADYERFRPLTNPLRMQCPLITVDTSKPVQIEAVAAAVRAADPR